MAVVRRKSLGRPVLYALVALGIYLDYRILGPFLIALTWAAIFAVLFHDLQTWLTDNRKLSPNRAALVTTLIVAAIVVVPAGLLISTLAHQLPQLTAYVSETSKTTPEQLQRTWDAIRARIPVSLPEDPTELMNDGMQRASAFLQSHAGAMVDDVLAMLGNLALTMFALFFLVRDGDAIAIQLRDLLPFAQEENESVLRETRDLVVTSVGSGIVSAIAAGVLGGLAFWLAGGGNPVFWGVVTGFASLLPAVGSTVVWVPAAIVLLLKGDVWQGILMLLMGTFGISMVGNIIRPLMLSGKTSVSAFVVFFGLLGGAAAFGVIGLVIGPIILVLTWRLLETLHRPDLLNESVPGDASLSAKAS
jgi:predicted PurR-regulated permease PerM